MDWIYQNAKISDVEKLLSEGYEIEVDSPDGWVKVNSYIDKGMFLEYILTLEDGRKISCNENHLFETIDGWVAAKNLLPTEYYLTDIGVQQGYITKGDKQIPIVDINVEHDNHRYYTNGVSSHNTGVGKSLVMCHMAGHHVISGHNVLYISMEMSEERLAERIDARLFNIPIQDIKNMGKESFDNKINKLKNKTKGKLIFKEFPTGGAHVGHFRALIEELRVKKNFVPRVIYVDYLNICASSRMKMGGSVNSYAYIKSIAEEIRGLAVEYDVPIITATQFNRTGSSSSDPNLEDTSESMGLPFSLDLYLALISGEELELLNQVLFKQLKNRYNDLNYYKRFVTGIDKSKMMLYNVESSAQETISNNDKGKSKQVEPDIPVFDRGRKNNNFGEWKI